MMRVLSLEHDTGVCSFQANMLASAAVGLLAFTNLYSALECMYAVAETNTIVLL